MGDVVNPDPDAMSRCVIVASCGSVIARDGTPRAGQITSKTMTSPPSSRAERFRQADLVCERRLLLAHPQPDAVLAVLGAVFLGLRAQPRHRAEVALRGLTHAALLASCLSSLPYARACAEDGTRLPASHPVTA
jgi:hypothetical protein